MKVTSRTVDSVSEVIVEGDCEEVIMFVGKMDLGVNKDTPEKTAYTLSKYSNGSSYRGYRNVVRVSNGKDYQDTPVNCVEDAEAIVSLINYLVEREVK